MGVRVSACVIILLLAGVAWGQQTPQSQSDVVTEALRVSPSITSGRQKVGEAQARLAEVEGQRRFQVSFAGTLSYSYGRVAEPPSLQHFGTEEASLVAPLPNGARGNAQVEQARHQLEAAQAQLRAAELDVEFAANQAFIEMWRAREAQSIAEENLAQATRQAEDTQKRIDAGDVPAADLLKAQVPVAQDRAALARAKIAASVAQQKLNDLLLRDLGAPVTAAPVGATGPLTISVDQAVATAMQRSPDILEAEANEAAARANVSIVKRARDPDLAMQFTHARTNDPTAYSHLTTLALTINLPLIDGGAAKQQLRQAESQFAQAHSALTVAKRALALSVQQAYLDEQGDEANAAATEETEKIALQSLEKARQAYNAGLTSTREVLDAQLVYSQARIDHNSALYDLAIARAHLNQLVGGNLP